VCTDNSEIPQVLIAGILPGFANFLEKILASWTAHFILRAKTELVRAMGNVASGRLDSKWVLGNLKVTDWVASTCTCGNLSTIGGKSLDIP